MFGSIEEAVEAYGVSKATIERKIAAGDIPSYRNGKGRRVWLKPFDGLKVTLEMFAGEIAALKNDAGDAGPRFLLTSEVADLLRVNRGTILDWVESGILPSTRIGRKVLFDRSELMKAVDGFRSGPVPS